MLKNEPINSINCNDVLEGMEVSDEVIFNVYFVSDEKLVKLNTIIKRKQYKSELQSESKNKYFISDETMWVKSLSSVRTKNDLFDFSNINPINKRNNDEVFLLEDVSVIVSLNKKQSTQLLVIDSIDWTNMNGLRVLGEYPIGLVQFLDPSIEYLKCIEQNEEKVHIRLKFYDRKEIVLYSLLDLSE